MTEVGDDVLGRDAAGLEIPAPHKDGGVTTYRKGATIDEDHPPFRRVWLFAGTALNLLRPTVNDALVA